MLPSLCIRWTGVRRCLHKGRLHLPGKANDAVDQVMYPSVILYFRCLLCLKFSCYGPGGVVLIHCPMSCTSRPRLEQQHYNWRLPPTYDGKRQSDCLFTNVCFEQYAVQALSIAYWPIRRKNLTNKIMLLCPTPASSSRNLAFLAPDPILKDSRHRAGVDYWLLSETSNSVVIIHFLHAVYLYES